MILNSGDFEGFETNNDQLVFKLVKIQLVTSSLSDVSVSEVLLTGHYSFETGPSRSLIG